MVGAKLTARQQELLRDNLRAFEANFGEVRLQKEDFGNYFSVWLNQAIDVHPPLFYFCLHFFSVFPAKF